MTNKERWAMALAVEPMIHFLLHRRKVPMAKRPDIVHDVLLKLYERAPDYDASKARWTTFSGWIIRGAIGQSITRDQDFGPVNTSIQKPSRVGLFRVANMPAPDGIEESDARIEVEKLANHCQQLDARELDSIVCSADGRTLTDVGKRYGVCRERIRQVRAEAIGKVRRSMSRAQPARVG